MNENHPPYPLQMNQTEEEKPLDFIRTKVKQDQENGKNDGRVHTVPTGTKWLPTFGTCEKYLPEFRNRRRIPEYLQSPFGRHQSGCGKNRICGSNHGRCQMARVRLGGSGFFMHRITLINYMNGRFN